MRGFNRQMTNEQTMFCVEKAQQIKNKPFKVLKEEPREMYKTSYDWWLHKKGHPLIGRKVEETFEVWKDGGWAVVNQNDYWYDQVDKDGNVILGPKGKPKRKFYFEQLFEWEIEFKDATEVFVYNKDVKSNCVETVTILKLRVKKSLNKRILDYLNDPRNKNTFMGITHDEKAPPADMYGIKYMSN